MTRVLIAGVSARAAASSAAAAGFEVTSVDAFADLDQHPSVRAFAAREGAAFTAAAAVQVARRFECDAVAYLSNFENYPAEVRALAAGRKLWGNPPEVLRRVRDPLEVAECLRRRGFATPEVLAAPETRSPKPVARWVIKPVRSGGGHAVRAWTPGTRVDRGSYIQEFIDGTPGSVVFAAAGGRSVPLGVTRQLVGDAAFGATGFRYCGNILSGTRDPELEDRAFALAEAVAQEFGLVGVNGIDFVAPDGIPWPIEVNPRWSGSVELVERAYGMNVFAAHAAACEHGALPPLMPEADVFGAVGKAVVFTRTDLIVGDTRGWLADHTVADVPREREAIPAGHPVCTVFAEGTDAATCRAALVRRAEQVYEVIDTWSRERVV